MSGVRQREPTCCRFYLRKRQITILGKSKRQNTNGISRFNEIDFWKFLKQEKAKSSEPFFEKLFPKKKLRIRYIYNKRTYKMRSTKAVQRSFQDLKRSVRSMTDKQKTVFLMKFILHSFSDTNREAIMDGLVHMLTLYPELWECWIIAATTFTKEEGERIALLYKYAVRESNHNRRQSIHKSFTWHGVRRK